MNGIYDNRYVVLTLLYVNAHCTDHVHSAEPIDGSVTKCGEEDELLTRTRQTQEVRGRRGSLGIGLGQIS